MILLADDDSDIRDLVCAVLLENGYVVAVAKDGAEAAILFEKHASDIWLVLTDLEMPKLDGEALARRIRSQAPELPILFMTGSGHSPGSTLAKPFTAQALLSKVRASLALLPDSE